MRPKKSSAAKTANEKTVSAGTDAPFPTDILPMLATLVNEPVNEDGWLYEVKWDGFRTLGYVYEGAVEVRSRNNKSFNEKFYPVYTELKAWGRNVVVDGEIVVLNNKGVPDFAALQTWRSEADGRLAYYLFDILWLEGKDLMDVPLHERRKILRSVVPQQSMIKLSENFEATGSEFFQLAERMGLEGIMAKRADSVYTPDSRSKDWLKIKTEKHQELIIGGYTKNEGTPKPFSALLLGWYTNGAFHHVTPVGTGFSVKMQKEILEKLKPLITDACPFVHVPAYNKPSRFRPNPPKADVTWVRPQTVCEISYREMTKDGAVRHPSFRGLREDKNPKEVVRETPAPIAEVVNDENKLVKKKVLAKPVKHERKTLLNPTEESQVKNVCGHDMKFTNLSKVYWPDENITKRDMLNYYYQVAPYIVPYIKDRPQTLNRYPHGIKGETFYQKDVKGKAPEWIKTFPYHSYSDGRDKEFLVATDEASLLYIASLGCIEINPWSSRTAKPDHPDWCIIDLDPDKNTFEQVMEAGCVTKSILDAIGVTAFAKTSGSTGLHIYIPFAAKYTYEDSKEFGRKLAKLIHARLPSFTSIERKVTDRKGKMYIDFLQNRPQATVAGPYSLRPKPGATVSMPLHWDEIKPGLTIKSFTIFNAVDRLREQGDIFTGVLGEGIDLEKTLQKLESVFG